jgi:poly-gamma-glutamate synthesis protein (capsule biosynthesis protein)
MTTRHEYLLVAVSVLLAAGAAWFAVHPVRDFLAEGGVAVAPARPAVPREDGLAAVTPEQPAPPDDADARGVRMYVVGDMMFGRTVERLMRDNGADYPLARFGGRVGSDDYDIVFGNLEGPIPAEHHPTPNGSTRFSFVPSTATWLRDHGFTLVSLANNHTLDWGQAGYDNTAKLLDEAGVSHFGHYSDEARDSFRFDKGNTHLTFVGFNLIEPSFDEENAVAWARKVDAERDGDLLIASIHWGEEYTHQANASQRGFAKALIGAGVDVIIGQHPHVTQGIELIEDKPVFWSFGNFLFDQYFSKETQESFAANIAFGPTVDPQGSTVGLMAVDVIPLASERSQMFAMAGERRTEWLRWLAGISDPLLKTQIESGMLRLTIAP